jgi:hypothetical protein
VLSPALWAGRLAVIVVTMKRQSPEHTLRKLGAAKRPLAGRPSSWLPLLAPGSPEVEIVSQRSVALPPSVQRGIVPAGPGVGVVG